MHPWFGDVVLPAPASASEIRDVVRHEIRGIGYPYQEYLPAAPLALPAAAYAELFRATRALVDLLRRTVLEAADTTEGRMALYGATERDYPLFLDDPFIEERYAHIMARPDIVIGPRGPQFLEFNISGGFAAVVESHCRYQAWEKLYGRDGTPAGLSYHDPFAARAALFADLCDELALPRRLAWMGTIRENVLPTTETRYFDLETDFLARSGFEARYFEPEELHQAWDCAERDRYPLGLRHVNVAELHRLGIPIEPIREALKNGCLLLSTQTSGFLGNKLTMGMLSEGRPWMSAAERALVERYLPWTRVLGDRRSTYRGEPVELLAFVLANQEKLVLKRGIGSNGRQVVIGPQTPPDRWRTEVEQAAADGGAIVQEYVHAQTCLQPIVTDSHTAPEVAQVAPVLSPILFGHHPGGVYVRFFADGARGIISVVGNAASDNTAVAV